ncbi:unnamed protein product [Hydatigera taeniaeformis]|uniref:RRM domain-containing protein n=1 Tax=Hydatigena taeniaeformis TaxID=6205 RepID=A0A0R3WHK2_HYDTA|nr:unnamed protein product [Hydatigera taeniaeformis]
MEVSLESVAQAKTDGKEREMQKRSESRGSDSGVDNETSSPSPPCITSTKTGPFEPSTSPQQLTNDLGKMFVGGLSHTTTEETLKTYFGKYGSIKETTVMRDPNNLRSRGFGFVTFEDPAAVGKVLESGPHYLESKKIDPKLAVPRIPAQNSKLETYGLMMDRETNRHRGFAFVTFENVDAANKVCEIRYHRLDNKRQYLHVSQGINWTLFFPQVEVKRALPKEVMKGVNNCQKSNQAFNRHAIGESPFK